MKTPKKLKFPLDNADIYDTMNNMRGKSLEYFLPLEIPDEDRVYKS